jgi:hypothetical protein
VICAVCLSGCTIVRIDGPAQVTRVYPGVLTISPEAGEAMVAYRSRGLGLVPGRNGITLGYADETVVALGREDECRVVLFEPDAASVGELAAILAGVVPEGQICNVGGSK